ncbi:hypothetical protein KAI87_08275, partial [Myxococcota bacterium]|nr:hypothetical protein [Myxococcota bacterium]
TALYKELDKVDSLDAANDPKSLALSTKDGAENKALTSLLDGISQKTESANMARRYEAKSSGPRAPKKDVMVATLLVKLQKGGLFTSHKTLKSRLPRDVQAKVDRDPSLSKVTPKIRTYSAFLKAVTIDADGDKKLDFDTFTLARMLQGNTLDTQQKIQDALIAEIPLPDLNRGLADVGFKRTLTSSEADKLHFAEPSALGTAAPKSDMGRIQQQFMRAVGVSFVDENKNDKIDSSDLVRFTEDSGAVKTQTYGEFKTENPDLNKIVLHDIANSEAIVNYFEQRDAMKYLSYNPNTRTARPEKVNPDFWKLTDSASKGTYWDLAKGKTPSQAITDVMVDHSSDYATECAQGRTLMMMHGLQKYYEADFGKEEGAFRFNALFAKDPQLSDKYLLKFENFKNANPSKGWSDFTAANQAPETDFSMRINRHDVLNKDNQQIQVFDKSFEAGASAGAPGYFRNTSVSPLGVNMGYIGENVVFAYVKDGIRYFWGHPDGIKSEKAWREDLSKGEKPIKKMSDFGQYFEVHRDVQDVGLWRDASIEDVKAEIKTLKKDKPVGWNHLVKTQNDQISQLKSLHAIRAALMENIDLTDTKDIQSFIKDKKAILAQGGNPFTKSVDYKPIVDALTPEARKGLAARFDKLPKGEQKQLAKSYIEESRMDSVMGFFGQEPDLLKDLKADQKALIIASQGYDYAVGSMDFLLGEIQQSITNNEATKILSDGPLGSRDKFQAWVKSDKFGAWAKKTHYQGPKDFKKMSVDDVETIVMKALPMVKHMKTIFSDMDMDIMLPHQMALLLKDGELPEASFDSEAVRAPLGL